MSVEDPRKRLLNRFKEETDTHLLKLQRLLVDLEAQPDNTDFLKEVFRSAHTIKGSAKMMGFNDISDVAHEMENILAEMRDGKLKLQSEITDLLFEGTDVINTLVEARVRGEEAHLDVNDLRQRLASVLKPVVATPAQVLLPVAANPLPGMVSAAHPIPPLDEKLLLPVDPVTPQAVLRAINPLNSNVIGVNIGKLDELMNITGELVLGKMEAEATLNNLRTLQDLMRQRQRRSGPIRNFISNQGRDPSEIITWQEIRETLVELNSIDQQLELLVRNTLRDYEEHTSQLVNRVDELENNVKSVRMLPIDALYQDMPPAVRQLARQNGREMPEYRQLGGEIELDKKMLEGIRDPLIHILNNALFHGIEKPEERTKVGKPRIGRLTIATSQDGGYVSIKVTDDGRGINPEEIRKAVIKKGFLSEAKAKITPDEEIINWIYEPGFSTAEIITDSAGRGVGMDVVKTNLEKLGGQVNVTTRIGIGTAVTLRVPVTLATSRALLVRLGDSVYALLAPSIESMHYLTNDKILSREGRDVMLYGDSLLPLVKLQDLINSNQREGHPLFRYQALNSERAALAGAGGSAGARTTNDHANGNGNGNSNGNANNGGYFQTNGTYNREAIEGDSFVGLTLADPRAIARIRELQEQNQERRVRQYNVDRLPAVVVGNGESRVCFLVDELVDETEIVVKSLSPLLARAQHINSATIMGDGQVIMILDVPSLVKAARSISRTGLRKQRQQIAKSKRILVVDDSITTRELERSILEAQGYIVELADDGTVALEMLNRDSRYDLVISDVEMPNMNGFELTANIKASPTLKAIPVIIVTSLNNGEHKHRGIEAGAQAYMTKGEFEQANLLNTIEYLTG